MSDCMTFPDTVEEFMDQYKIVDTEHVYTNGAELVPVFRMKQWFEHLPSIQPDIIHCKECKQWGRIDRYKDGTTSISCKIGWSGTPDGFCHLAKRRTNGES